MATKQQAHTDAPESPAEPYAREQTQSGTDNSVPPGELLELLGDEYTQRVLATLRDQSRTGQEIISVTDVSKPTVYRRLANLEEAGLVETTQRVDPDGHHCKEYHAVVEAIDVEFGSDGLGVAIETAPASSGSQTQPMIADD